VTSLFTSSNSHIRRLEVPGDLMAVADLIDLCFAGTMDEDGIEYLEHIRKAASDPGLVRWIPAAGELVSFPLHGFVWVDHGTIIGNLSLIPFFWENHWRFLVANVAVHPEYRRLGIGRKLTQKALDHVRSLRQSSVWLHVRAENLPAIRLYESMDFHEISRRTSWQHDRSTPSKEISSPIQVTARKASDWQNQKKWLNAAYPSEVAWNLGFIMDRFRPGLWASLSNLLNNQVMQHWVARSTSQILGAVTWEPTRQYADTLWLATQEGDEEKVIPLLLQAVCHDPNLHRPLAVNFPAGRAANTFQQAGFHLVHNLIWMENHLNK
jgi:ribosomal protein S18 acetylase RimI-like enzyme